MQCKACHGHEVAASRKQKVAAAQAEKDKAAEAKAQADAAFKARRAEMEANYKALLANNGEKTCIEQGCLNTVRSADPSHTRCELHLKQHQPPPAAAKMCACGSAVASSNPAHTQCRACFNKARTTRRGQVATASKPAAQAPAATVELPGMPRVQNAFDKASARLKPFQVQGFAAKVLQAGKQGVPHASIAQALESGQCVFADKCSLRDSGQCKRHAVATAPVSPPAKKKRGVKKNVPAPVATPAPQTVPAAAAAAPAVIDGSSTNFKALMRQMGDQLQSLRKTVDSLSA
jgi:hypothetical protein